ncbi:MAG: YggT family protein [Ilumatobacteraceae bacterium]
MPLVLSLLNLFSLAIFARAILSFFPISPSSPLAALVQFLYRITEPVLAPIRRVLPPMGGLDLSPLVVIIGIQVLSSILL